MMFIKIVWSCVLFIAKIMVIFRVVLFEMKRNHTTTKWQFLGFANLWCIHTNSKMSYLLAGLSAS